jgi:hypothetical protein
VIFWMLELGRTLLGKEHSGDAPSKEMGSGGDTISYGVFCVIVWISRVFLQGFEEKLERSAAECTLLLLLLLLLGEENILLL